MSGGQVRAPLPTGNVTFCFTDIEGSTRLFHRFGDRYEELLKAHRRIVRRAVTDHGGVEVRTDGDGFFLAFADASAALAAVVQIQRGIAGHAWPEGGRIRVRIGLHAGEGVVRDGDYVALAVHQAARVSAAAHGDQILLSEDTAVLAGPLPDGCDTADHGLFRLKGFDEPVRLLELRHDPSVPGPPPNALSAVLTNFPTPRSSYVGRSSLRTSIAEKLSEGRLITLTGMGGIGKTRTAVEVASSVRDQYRDGVWFVDLSAITDPRGVIGAFTEAVGTGPDGDASLFDVLARRLSGEQLVVVDNCEHVIDEAALVVDGLLDRQPAVVVLATSREPLRLDDEIVFRLEGLPLPEQKHEADPQGVAVSDAVRLFVDRAVRAEPTFNLDRQNASAVEGIVAQLDGIPLALEMAGARIGEVGVAALLERLHEPGVLGGGGRLARPRQQTLDATIRWSYDLLSDEERRLFRALSVFTAAVTAEDVDAVCPPARILWSLCEKSLVVAGERSGMRVFRMLVPVREFAQRMLDGDEAFMVEIRQRHLAWCCALREEKRFGEEHIEDAWAAVAFGVDHPDLAEPAGVLAQSTVSRLRLLLRAEEAMSLGLLALGSDHLSDDLRAMLCHNAGAAAWSCGQYGTARAQSLAGLHIAEAQGFTETMGRCLNNLGAIARSEFDMDESRSCFERAIALARTAGAKEPEIASLHHLGLVARLTGEFSTAMFRFGEALRLAIDQRDVRWQIACLTSIADAACGAGDTDVARARCLQALDLVRDTRMLGRAGWEAEALALLARASWAAGDYDEALQHIEDGFSILREAPGDVRAEVLLGLMHSMVARSMGRVGEAASDLHALLDPRSGRHEEDDGDLLLQCALVAIVADRAAVASRLLATLESLGHLDRLVDVPVREDMERVLAGEPSDPWEFAEPFPSAASALSAASDLMSAISSASTIS